MSVLLGRGDGTFQARQAFAAGPVPTSVAVGDFNEDGVEDLVSADSSGDTTSALLGTSLHGVSALHAFSLASRDAARDAMTYFAEVQTRISSQRAIVGAFESRARYAVNTVAEGSQESTAAESRIADADVAEETAIPVKNRIPQQAGAAVLARANQEPALALTLLRGHDAEIWWGELAKVERRSEPSAGTPTIRRSGRMSPQASGTSIIRDHSSSRAGRTRGSSRPPGTTTRRRPVSLLPSAIAGFFVHGALQGRWRARRRRIVAPGRRRR